MHTLEDCPVAETLLRRIIGPDAARWTKSERQLANEAALYLMRAEAAEARLRGYADAAQCNGFLDSPDCAGNTKEW